MTESDDIVHEVVIALAEADDAPPEDLDYSLAEYVDPDVLKSIVSGDGTCTLTFRVPEHEVTVTDAGEVFVDGIQHRPETGRSLLDPNQPSLSGSPAELPFRRLVDHLPCMVYQSRDEAGQPIDFVSESCRELTGYDPNAFVLGGVNYVADLVHPDDRAAVRETVRDALTTGEPFTLTYRIRTARGAERRVVDTGVGLVDEDDPVPLVGVVVDITDMESTPEILQGLRK